MGRGQKPTVEDIRRRVVTSRRVVVKVGSGVLAGGHRFLDAGVMAHLVRDLVRLFDSDREVILVSSGAILAGRVVLGLERRPDLLPEQQAAAAVGQIELLYRYRELFGWYGRTVAQVLLTGEDLRHRQRYLNARNTIRELLDEGIIPIINENDTVAVDEIRFGDNDLLSALVANLVEADLLILLSDIEGLYDRHPGTDEQAELIPIVSSVNEEVEAMAGGEGSSFGLGGMKSKLQAVKRTMASGIPAVLAGGRRSNVLLDILEGKEVGTLFFPSASRLSRRKHWLAFATKPKGSLWLDEGACKAICERGRSLLARGIHRVEGHFAQGDAVSLLAPGGDEIARGLVNYRSEDLLLIRGLHSREIEQTLGHKDYDEVVHRDNMVTTGQGTIGQRFTGPFRSAP